MYPPTMKVLTSQIRCNNQKCLCQLWRDEPPYTDKHEKLVPDKICRHLTGSSADVRVKAIDQAPNPLSDNESQESHKCCC